MEIDSLNFKNSEERLQFFDNLEQEVLQELKDGIFSPDSSEVSSRSSHIVNNNSQLEISDSQKEVPSIDTTQENIIVKEFEKQSQKQMKLEHPNRNASESDSESFQSLKELRLEEVTLSHMLNHLADEINLS